MKGRKISILLLLIITASLCACSKDESEPIDVKTQNDNNCSVYYTLVDSSYNEDLWINDFCIANDNVYYVGSFGKEKSALCTVNSDCSGKNVLCVFDPAQSVPISISDDEENIFVLFSPSDLDAYDGSVPPYFIKTFDMMGIPQGDDIELGNLALPQSFLPSAMIVVNNVAVIQGTDTIITVDLKKGDLLDVLSFANPCAIESDSNGNIYVGQCKDDGTMLISRLNIANGDMIDLIKLDKFISFCGHDTSGGLFLSDINYLYALSTDSFEMSTVFQWSMLGLSNNNCKVKALSDGSLLCNASLNPMVPSPMLRLIKSDVPHTSGIREQKLVIAMNSGPSYRDSRVTEVINEWNRTHPQCPVEIKDYSGYYDGTDPRSAELKIAADLSAGNFPDIYEFSNPIFSNTPSSLSPGLLARKGMLVDLYTYLDKDPDISRDTFFPSMLSALEINDGLYEAVFSYRLYTATAKGSIVGDKDDWSFDNLQSIVDNSDYFTSLFCFEPTVFNRDEGEYDNLLSTLIDASGDKLVNWDTGKAYFDSDYFKTMLQTVKNAQTARQLDPSRTGLLTYSYKNLFDASNDANDYDNDVVYVGIPGVGNAICPEMSYGISAFSQNKDMAWEFIKTLWMKTEHQGFPLFATMRKDTTYAAIDAEINRYTDEVKSAQPYAREAMNAFCRVLESDISVAARHDSEIWEIVQPEFSAYLVGDRTADQTAKNIQSKVSIYLAEQG